ncbi:MAG TPA: tetratricopeptide repeat protein [Burkholderiales bacterium]|nr:tetratricopeptide repeat protein [Burkholderiales bacterium]
MRRVALTALAPLVLGLLFLSASPLRADPGEETPGAGAADSDYAAGKKAAEARDWKGAIRLLGKAELQDDRNPDLQNLLGYAYRNSGNFDLAFKHYERALALNPRHRGAHEYVGEAYLLVGNLVKAEEHLGALRQICLIPCEEYADLKAKIDAYRRGPRAK